MSDTVTASAPGSLMLFGEHAVLHGRLALVCAVDRRLRVRATRRADRRVLVESALGHAESELDALALPPPFRFIEACLRRALPALDCGLELRVDSEFPATVGLGSSAAVTVATLAALAALAPPGDATPLHAAARDAIRAVQGIGSGADAAASALGGIVAFRTDPPRAERLPAAPPPLTAEAAIAAGDWPRVGVLMNAGQGLMEALGVGNAALAEIVALLRADLGVLGAKISGSGLGDCAIGLGRADWREARYEALPVAISGRGVEIEQA